MLVVGIPDYAGSDIGVCGVDAVGGLIFGCVVCGSYAIPVCSSTLVVVWGCDLVVYRFRTFGLKSPDVGGWGDCLGCRLRG